MNFLIKMAFISMFFAMLKVIVTRWFFVAIFIVLSVPAIFATLNAVSDKTSNFYNEMQTSPSPIARTIAAQVGGLGEKVSVALQNSPVVNAYKAEYEKAGIPISEVTDTIREYADHELSGQPASAAGYYKDKLDQTLKAVEK
jgi:hypothetical protein